MTILEIILRMLGKGADEAPDIEQKLLEIAEKAPDVAPQANQVLEVLRESVSPENLLAVGPDVVGALWDISHGKFKPVKGAGDTI